MEIGIGREGGFVSLFFYVPLLNFFNFLFLGFFFFLLGRRRNAVKQGSLMLMEAEQMWESKKARQQNVWVFWNFFSSVLIFIINSNKRLPLRQMLC